MNIEKLRVAIGVASESQSGWLALTQSDLDITNVENWLRYFKPGTIDNILAEHVWEHLTWNQAHLATSLCFRFLRPGGRMRLAVPDTLHASQYIVDAVSATGSFAAEHHHLVDYNFKLMNRLLSGNGFQVEILDWWDEDGNFHNRYAGNDDHGYVMRSYVNWPKHPSVYREPEIYRLLVDSVPEEKREDFLASGITHTSLIVDGIKPI